MSVSAIIIAGLAVGGTGILIGFFLGFFGGIQALIDLGNLTAPAPAAHMIQLHDLIHAPVKIIRDKRHLPIKLLFRIQLYPSSVKFSGTRKTSPQDGQTHSIVGGSISLIRWYISCKNARSAVKSFSMMFAPIIGTPSSSVTTLLKITIVR